MSCLNLHRRHLSASQKAVAEVELSKWARVGHNQHGGSAPGAEAPEVRTTPQMAKAAEVGTRTIEQAKVVVEAGLQDAVKAGEVSVKRAAEVEISQWARVGNPTLQPNPVPGTELEETRTVPQMAKAAEVGERTISGRPKNSAPGAGLQESRAFTTKEMAQEAGKVAVSNGGAA